MNRLDPVQMSGTVMAVTEVARPAIEGMQRIWPNFARGNDLIDMNRGMARKRERCHRAQPTRRAPVQPAAAAERRRRDRLPYRTTGFDVTAFNIAGMDVPDIKAMVDLYPVGQVFDNTVKLSGWQGVHPLRSASWVQIEKRGGAARGFER
jgi:predicted deacylase